MTRPDDVRPRGDQTLDQAGGLWVVHHHDIAGLHEHSEALGVPPRDLVVVGALLGPQLATVPEVPVEAVVDPLRDLEEPGVALEDRPPHPQSVTDEVAEVRAKQLRDAATFCCGVDMPQRPWSERRPGAGERRVEPIDVVVVDDREEARGGAWRNRCLIHASARIVAWLGLDIAKRRGTEMGKDDPVALYIAAYDDPNAAQEDYDALKELVKAGAIFVDVAALVARDDEGKLYVKENAHEVAGGTIVGAAAGLLIGLIFPPAFLASGVVGGAVGAGVGKLVKMDRTSDIKKEVEDTLPAGTSGIIALFDITWKPKVDETLTKAKSIDREEVSPESAEELKKAASKS